MYEQLKKYIDERIASALGTSTNVMHVLPVKDTLTAVVSEDREQLERVAITMGLDVDTAYTVQRSAAYV